MQGHLCGGTDLQASLNGAPGDDFPFRCEVSLKPLIDFWTRAADSGSAKGALARIVADEVRKAPELLSPITSCSTIASHKDLLDVLMTAVFSSASWEQSYGAVMAPFQLRGFYATPLMRQLLMAEDGTLQGRVNMEDGRVAAMRRAYAYALILKRVYGIGFEVDYPVVITAADPETGLDRHFRIFFDWQFVDVETIGPVPALPPDVEHRLYSTALDSTGLDDLLPPDRFVFRGITIFKCVDVTDQEVLSALKRDLIDRESIVSQARFMGLQQRLRTLFRRPELRLGLGAIDGGRVLILNCDATHEHACIFADSEHHEVGEFAGSIFERAVKTGQPVIVSDLAEVRSRTPVEAQVLASGVRGMLVAPLHYQDKIIGTLTLQSPNVGDLDATHLPKLHEVLPLFSMAVQRSMDELNVRIQTEIKERFTAIHPVVEWRFRKAVLDELEKDETVSGVELRPIVFEQVYPLYALSDIRGSSTQRALAIQSDLITQLRLARDVVEAAHDARHLPALDHLRYRIDELLAQIATDVAAGDELGVISFLRTEIESVFALVAGFGEAVERRIAAYRTALDPRLGAVYRQRRLFEESVTRISETISSYLDLEEEAAQSMVPHYFEKRTTDGVDHQIYVGGALREDGHFDPLYLKSLRLWQLMVVCGIAARAEKLAQSLTVPLQVTHLILVQDAPLAIRFRSDEKRFDVDGAYDMRYEIVKKRIDKALVKGSRERITQPGRIAIVYSNPAEATEYRGYLEYLHHLGYVAGEVEDLDLEELQGVHGLRALRATVTLRQPPDRAVAPDVARTALRSVP
ncbi:MAG TPA: GAF domain-containing protein [Methylomirabilota bacterium]|nr:GAF domain-containing protein [Methylomirabilota bacterium]